MIAFLSLKQIVDMLYQFKVLDYLMVIAALVLIGYKIYKSKGIDFKKICIVDVLVSILALLYGLATLRNLDGIAEGCKIESAFLVYVFGRLYGNEIHKAGRYLAYVGYAIVYVNAAYYFIKFFYYYSHNKHPFLEEGALWNSGALYYYKTDLGIALIIAAIFIYVYSDSIFAKYLTLYDIIPTFIFLTNARMGQFIYTLLLVAISIIELSKIVKKRKENASSEENSDSKTIFNKKKSHGNVYVLKGIFITGIIFISLLFILIYFSPIKESDYNNQTIISAEFSDRIENICHSRHIIIWDTFHYIMNEPFITQMIGVDIDIISFSLHNSSNMMSHNMYLTALYGTGYLGFYLFILVLYYVLKSALLDESKEKGKNKFLIFTLWGMFLVHAFTMDALEYTQISWFPFIFAGISAGNLVKKKENE